MTDAGELDDVREAAARLVADVDGMRAEVAAEAVEERRRAADRRAGIEDARRSGEHGRDWQVLQQRIDLHETTESDILFGLDHSSEARAVRRVVGENLAQVRTAYRQQLSDPDEELASSLASLAAVQEELSAVTQRLRLLAPEPADPDNR